ncbi:hypothetical protein JZ751_023321 [Albula glossodonta]|uniref:Protein phosphatase 1 regulatory subunit 1A n=1 Tax=Albula glossodonta TaxID=121402 RepID=A0A8T2NGZ8_9TELE|nr:hypothetical protein JZ751_023321 [Albula glossodonta]
METSSPRRIQFTMPLLDSQLDPEAAEQAALMNSPLQRRKGARGTPTMKELQFLVEHHLYRQQQGGGEGEECSSESCLSDRPSPDSAPGGAELPRDEEGWGMEDQDPAQTFHTLCCQLEEFSRESQLKDIVETITPSNPSLMDNGSPVPLSTATKALQEPEAAGFKQSLTEGKRKISQDKDK